MKNRDFIIKNTIQKLNRLPDEKLPEVENFIDFLLAKMDDALLTEGIQELTSESKAFKYLEHEENLYSVEDLKEKYK
ncbi:hypothetical protein D1614_18245 [Maribellus luteus]|uniref:DUF2281 domain-containing protein n=1 Tax=Maribellus luteus TaxID=2305463 RepID=A0A399SS49_9BACT|nr:hypothetical protein [Maribellus luteus]RIJ46610.1 hypothetical protein D1614_18245 [Maribellus luteus]